MDLSLNSLIQLASQGAAGFKHFQFGNKAQLAFLEDFYALVNDGIPANRAIEMMAEVTSGINQEVALSISQKISEGQPLAEGMREWFSMNVVEIVRVGEEGGILNATIRSAITTLDQRTSTWGAFFTAITYPLVVMLMACVIIVYLDKTVFDQFRQIKPIAEWPAAGQSLVSTAHLLERGWWVLLLMIATIVFLFRYAMHNYIGELRPLLDRFPPFSLYRRFAAAYLMETMGLLVANGVVFKNAIKIMQYQANPYLISHLVMMEHLLGMGRGNISDVLATGLISDADVMRLRVLAEVKGFEHALIRMGVRGAEESAKTMKLIARILGGVFLVLGAWLILVIVRGVYLTGMSIGAG